MTLFSWVCFVLYRLWVLIMWFSWKIFLFYSLLEGFRTSLQNFVIKLVRILHFGRVFKYAKLIFKLIFENPNPRLDGRPCLVYPSWISFKHVHEREIVWVIYLILIIFSIGIPIDIFFGCILICIFYMCML